MQRLLAFGALLALLGPIGQSGAEVAGARVIVSTTLNDTLQFFDASSLEQLQTPLPSKGAGPVRLWVQDVGGHAYLFVANHGLMEGSVGVFDLAGEQVSELPLSPFPARPGSVGITAGNVGSYPMVFVTNTYQALAGCDMPRGSVTAFHALYLNPAGVLVDAGTVEVTGAQPWGVALDEANKRAYVSGNCADDMTRIDVDLAGQCLPAGGLCFPSISHGGSSFTSEANGPDATVFDASTGLTYTVNIASSNVTIRDDLDVRSTVPLPEARPIDATLGTTPGGRRLLFTSNGGDDSVSLLDTGIMAACLGLTCEAEIARIQTAVPGGAPEGVAYDPGTNRVFVVNKTFAPSLSVIQLTEHPDGSITGEDIAQIPLNALGVDVPIPAVIAFDVVVQQR